MQTNYHKKKKEKKNFKMQFVINRNTHIIEKLEISLTKLYPCLPRTMNLSLNFEN